MKGIGYIRWSTDDQSVGNSLERQRANIQTYCQRNKLELTDTLTDDGYSAFKGHHLSKGKLGPFLTECDKGKYRGRALVVEHTDRLSRQGIDETWQLTRRLLNDGLELHVTQQNRVVRSLDDLPTVILQAVDSYAAQEYSRKMSERVGKAWQSKKCNGVSGVALTSHLPGWLYGKSGEAIKVNEARAKIVRQIFEWSAAGAGQRVIARRLNAQKIRPFGGGPQPKTAAIWTYGYIHKILHSRAVLGEFQPRKRDSMGRSVPDGEPRPNFFPVVVTPELWQRAQNAMRTRRTSQKSFSGRPSHNLFSGLVVDATNMKMLPMYYQDKHRGAASLQTAGSESSSGIKPHRIDYALFAKGFLTFLDQLDWTAIVDVADTEELNSAQADIDRLSFEIERGQEEAEKIVKWLPSTPSRTLSARLQNIEAQIDSKKAAREAAQQKLEELQRKNRDLLDKSVDFSQLANSPELWERLRQEIRRKVKSIWLSFPEDKRWRGIDVPQQERPVGAIVGFVNGVVRSLMFDKDGTLAFGDLRDYPEVAHAIKQGRKDDIRFRCRKVGNVTILVPNLARIKPSAP